MTTEALTEGEVAYNMVKAVPLCKGEGHVRAECDATLAANNHVLNHGVKCGDGIPSSHTNAGDCSFCAALEGDREDYPFSGLFGEEDPRRPQ